MTQEIAVVLRPAARNDAFKSQYHMQMINLPWSWHSLYLYYLLSQECQIVIIKNN